MGAKFFPLPLLLIHPAKIMKKQLIIRIPLKKNILAIRSFFLLLLSCIALKTNLCFPSTSSSYGLGMLSLEGHLTFDEVQHAARDFGNRYQFLPLAVLHPTSVSDIAVTVKHIFQKGASSKLTVAARGHGHSLQGQSQAHGGVVVNMESLKNPKMKIYPAGKFPYVDVSGGELWINILRESLKYGLAPKSWTDYLHLTVGGTLSNAGISGQAFRHGPQISSVHQLEVVTGKGEIVKCSPDQNEDLFYGVLGGLGQFGIITQARISLEPAPDMVKWIRVLYSDFNTFTRDQEHLISSAKTFDYVEGFVIINRTNLMNHWRSSFSPQDPVQASQFTSSGKTLFCLEVAKYYDYGETDEVAKEVEMLLSQLSYISSTLFFSEVPYIEFLDRVLVSEIKLRSKGLWEVPHPWLNLLIPKSTITKFAEEVFATILTDSSKGPILIYPVNKSKWDNRTSVVIPEEDIFYLVAVLSSAVPSSTKNDDLDHMLQQNKRILDFCQAANLGVKQYLSHYSRQEDWKVHFGPRWEVFVQRKSAYDPLAILAPGQRIFQKALPFS